ncbi:hypothetical protein GX48_06101 [Paracoccidioides brasiliensis]|nr:hypothetical protein GX48_06101 [Paracoccidioides brasiliensis]
MVPIHSFIHGSTVKRIPLSVIVDGDDDDGEIQMASHSEFWKRVNVKTNASRAANSPHFVTTKLKEAFLKPSPEN